MKQVLPKSFLRWRAERLNAHIYRDYLGLPPQQVFAKIYKDRAWGGESGEDFSSGSGSHRELIVGPYVHAIRSLLSELDLPARPLAVDLGCGDFNIGSQIRPLCSRYVACDIVPDLIRRNRERWKGLDVDFRCIDIINDELPQGDICFVRQVLQHLNNEQIARIVPKLRQFRYVVATEHLPSSPFVPNADKIAGPGIRLWQCPPSGVVLTSHPFCFSVKSERTLCEVAEQGGVIRTILYEVERIDS